jgi:hypothetical protein
MKELLSVQDSIFSYPEVIQWLHRDEIERLKQEWEQLQMDKKNIKNLKNDLLWNDNHLVYTPFSNIKLNVSLK